jgi:hypothetical protein
MLSDKLRVGRWLMFVVLLAPVYVRPKGIQVEKNEWSTGEAKEKAGRFDKEVDKTPKKNRSSTGVSRGDSNYDPASELDDDPLAVDSSAATNLAENSSNGGWMWGILASLCVAGLGLACFSYYWSRSRNASAW